MRQMVKHKFGCPITIEALERLQLPSSNSTSHGTSINVSQISNTNSLINSSLLNSQQQQSTPIVQQPLYTTVQTQQKVNILQASQSGLNSSGASLLSQQQQQQQQARVQAVRSRVVVLHLLKLWLIAEHSWTSSIVDINIGFGYHKFTWYATDFPRSASDSNEYSIVGCIPTTFDSLVSQFGNDEQPSTASFYHCQPSADQNRTHPHANDPSCNSTTENNDQVRLIDSKMDDPCALISCLLELIITWMIRISPPQPINIITSHPTTDWFQRIIFDEEYAISVGHHY
jgi:hypothetical protein